MSAPRTRSKSEGCFCKICSICSILLLPHTNFSVVNCYYMQIKIFIVIMICYIIFQMFTSWELRQFYIWCSNLKHHLPQKMLSLSYMKNKALHVGNFLNLSKYKDINDDLRTCNYPVNSTNKFEFKHFKNCKTNKLWFLLDASSSIFSLII
jgi:hypothetical protein